MPSSAAALRRRPNFPRDFCPRGIAAAPRTIPAKERIAAIWRGRAKMSEPTQGPDLCQIRQTSPTVGIESTTEPEPRIRPTTERKLGGGAQGGGDWGGVRPRGSGFPDACLPSRAHSHIVLLYVPSRHAREHSCAKTGATTKAVKAAKLRIRPKRPRGAGASSGLLRVNSSQGTPCKDLQLRIDVRELAVAPKQVVSRRIAGVGRHEMREFESDDLLRERSRCLELEP